MCEHSVCILVSSELVVLMRMDTREWRKLPISVPKPLVKRIDDYWHKAQLPNRAAAIRALLQIALDHVDTSPSLSSPSSSDGHVDV